MIKNGQFGPIWTRNVNKSVTKWIINSLMLLFRFSLLEILYREDLWESFFWVNISVGTWSALYSMAVAMSESEAPLWSCILHWHKEQMFFRNGFARNVGQLLKPLKHIWSISFTCKKNILAMNSVFPVFPFRS